MKLLKMLCRIFYRFYVIFTFMLSNEEKSKDFFLS